MTLLDTGVHSGFLQQILHFDYWLFSKINQQWTNSFFDHVFPFLRESEIWIPFYLFLLVFITLNFRVKGWWWAAALIMTAIISDLVSSSLIKQNIIRLRPCRNPYMADSIRVLVKYCPISSSFTSSHACNHFAVATFIFCTLQKTSKWWALVFAWAFFISYAQVYVGVHYPLDVVCGGIIGSLVGYAMSIFFRKRSGLLILKTI